jgi:acyl-coenzyme A thioesterase PaaI-like protein
VPDVPTPTVTTPTTPTTTGPASEGSGALDPQAVLDGLVELGEGLAFNRHLGCEVREASVGRCVVALPANPALDNHIGGVHAIAELAPVEFAGALAASSRLAPLLARGYVPVVGRLATRYRAPAAGELVATAEVGPEVLGPALEAADAGERPRVTVEVEVTDAAGTVVNVTELGFVYLATADGGDGPV